MVFTCIVICPLVIVTVLTICSLKSRTLCKEYDDKLGSNIGASAMK